MLIPIQTEISAKTQADMRTLAQTCLHMHACTNIIGFGLYLLCESSRCQLLDHTLHSFRSMMSISWSELQMEGKGWSALKAVQCMIQCLISRKKISHSFVWKIQPELNIICTHAQSLEHTYAQLSISCSQHFKLNISLWLALNWPSLSALLKTEG